MRTRLVAVLLVPASCLAACDGDSTEKSSDPIALEGRYRLQSSIDLTASSLVPPPVAATIDLLTDLRYDPGAAIFELAELAGVPAVDELRGALPGPLESRLEAWVGERVIRVLNDEPEVATALDLVLEAATAVVGEIDLTSELTAAGGTAQHRILAVGFDVAGTAASFPVDGAPLTSRSLTYRIEASADGSEITFGGHGFGIPVGTFAYQALEAEVARRTGTDVRGVLARAVDCPRIAAEVAGECVLDVCVGHQDDLLALCEGAVDYLADELQARITETDLDVLELREGTAWLADDDGNGVAEVVEGWWSAWLDLGAGPRETNATFVGVRQP